MGEEEKIVVKTFGINEVRIGESTVHELIGNSKKVWGFLVFMMKHRAKPNLQKTLISIFWENREVKNPYNSLKTLVYRIRKIFIEAGFPWGKVIILSRKNAYLWNDIIPVEADFEIFEQLCGQLFSENIAVKEEISIAQQAFHLYQGDFLSDFVSEKWIGYANSYYHSLYIRLVCYLIELYKKKRMYHLIIDLCLKAIQIDNTIEEFHYNLVYAYLEEENVTEANRQYQEAAEVLRNRYGIELSERFKMLYHQIIELESQVKYNLVRIKYELMEDMKKPGAFVCDYTMFKKIYNLNLRFSERNSPNSFLALITITRKEDIETTGYLKDINNCLEIVAKSLRRSDVISRCSQNQFVVLLQADSRGNIQSAMDRVKKNYKKEYPGNDICMILDVELVN